MKKLFLEKYRLVNLFLLLITVATVFFMDVNYEKWFKGPNALDFYDYYYAIYSPIFVSLKWLAGILTILLFFPSAIFKRWLFFIATPILLITYMLVQNISVYSGNLLNPTRAKMAENCMMVLAVVTLIFVVSSLLYTWYKRKR